MHLRADAGTGHSRGTYGCSGARSRPKPERLRPEGKSNVRTDSLLSGNIIRTSAMRPPPEKYQDETLQREREGEIMSAACRQGETETQWVFPERLAGDSSRCHFWSPMSSIAPGRKIESFRTLHSRAFTNWRGRRRPMRKLKDRSPRRHPPKYGAMDIEPPERSERNSGRCRAFQGTSPWSFDVRR